MTLNCDVIKLTMVMIPIHHAAPPLLQSPDKGGPGMTLNRDIIKPKMVMIPINHTDPFLLSPDNVGPCMTLNLGVIKLTMVMIPIHHAPPPPLTVTWQCGAWQDIKLPCDKAHDGQDSSQAFSWIVWRPIQASSPSAVNNISRTATTSKSWAWWGLELSRIFDNLANVLSTLSWAATTTRTWAWGGGLLLWRI